jgi:hypothetical protein
MKTYLCSVWALYFQIACLIRARTKTEAKEILCRHYQPRFPRIELADIAVYDVEKLSYSGDGLFEVSRTD